MALPGYAWERPLVIDAPSGLSAGAVVRVTGLETRTLIATGTCRPDRRDFRVTYNGTEIDRVMLTTGSFAFRLQADIPLGESSTAYAISHGNADEATEPAEDPRNVWPAYYDGNDLASFTTTGTVTATDAPAPGFLKLGANPTLTRTPGTFDWKTIREVELFYEGGWFYATYDADDVGTYDGHLGWTSYIARSRDLLSWEKLGEILAPGGGGADNASASDIIIHQFPGLSGYFATYLGTNVLMSGSVPSPPYTLHGATATSPLGPWTKTGILLPLGAPGAFDSYYNVDGVIFTLDGGTTYRMVYGAASSDSQLHTAALATASHPLGPWTKNGKITDDNQWIENPRILNDSARGVFYLMANAIAGAAAGLRASSDVLYWSTDMTSFRDGRTVIIEPDDEGGWDSYTVGVVSTPVIQNGMIYVGYDASNYANYSQPDGIPHGYRDAGFAEARWPFPWTKFLTVATGGTATSSAVLSGAGEVRARCRVVPGGGPGFAMEGVGESYQIQVDPVEDEIGWLRDELNLYVNGVLVTPSIGGTQDLMHFDHSMTFTFRRTGGTLTILHQGSSCWSGSSSAALSFKAYGGTIVEEVVAKPAAVVGVEYVPPTVALPSALAIPNTALGTTGSIVGATVELDADEYVSWVVDAGQGGTFRLDFGAVGSAVAVSVDASPVVTLPPDIFGEEEGEIMPQGTKATHEVTVPTATVTRIDAAGATGAAAALTGRQRVRVVNPHGSTVLYIGSAASGVGSPDPTRPSQKAHPDYGGVWEDFIETTIPIYVYQASGSDMVVGLEEYAA